MANPIKSFIHLSDALDKDYTWRKNELYHITKNLDSGTSAKEKAFLRSALPMLYAHWEGFTKNATSYYVEFVKYQRLNHYELQTQFIALSLNNKLNLLDVNNIEAKTEIIDGLINEFGNRSNIPHKNVIKTKSNLKFSVFQEILFIVGIDLNLFKQYSDLIDDLVISRNHIAHGQFLKVDKPTFDIMCRETLAVMTRLKTEIENSAVLKKYKDVKAYL